jgi:hypothetical protein
LLDTHPLSQQLGLGRLADSICCDLLDTHPLGQQLGLGRDLLDTHPLGQQLGLGRLAGPEMSDTHPAKCRNVGHPSRNVEMSDTHPEMSDTHPPSSIWSPASMGPGWRRRGSQFLDDHTLICGQNGPMLSCLYTQSK